MTEDDEEEVRKTKGDGYGNEEAIERSTVTVENIYSEQRRLTESMER